MAERAASLIASQKQTLDALVRLGGWKPTRLARAAGLAPSTINKFIKNPSPRTALSARTIAKLLDATEKRLQDVNAGGEQLQEFASLRKSAEWHGEIEAWQSDQRQKITTITVVGAVGMDTYLPEAEWPPEKRYDLPFPKAMIEGRNPFALEVQGQVMDADYPPGTILICIPLAELGRDLHQGDHVVCHRRREDGMVNPCVREYAIDRNGTVWLAPKSTEPGFQSWPLAASNGGETTEISAVVVGFYKRRI